LACSQRACLFLGTLLAFFNITLVKQHIGVTKEYIMATQKAHAKATTPATSTKSAQSASSGQTRKKLHPPKRSSSSSTAARRSKHRASGLQSHVVDVIKELPEQVSHGLSDIAEKLGEAASAAASMTASVVDEVAHKIGGDDDEQTTAKSKTKD
jgi:hypothetical protein